MHVRMHKEKETELVIGGIEIRSVHKKKKIFFESDPSLDRLFVVYCYFYTFLNNLFFF